MRLLTIAAALLFATGLRAGEHPEHPMGPATGDKTPAAAPSNQGEHPAGHEHPGHTHPAGSKEWKKQIRKEYNAAVEDYVRAQSKDNPGFPVKDEKLGKQRDLKLINVHKDKIVHLGGDKFFACADFKTVEKGKKDKVDLDFYASKGAGGWNIDKVVIHKVNGVPRYTYNEKNEMVPAAN